MVTELKSKAPRKATRRRKPPEEFVDYIVEIDDWDCRPSACAVAASLRRRPT
ncbi:hypothetical protein PMN64_00275 [Bradyrhizobium sp. UFLA01-814]|uniref:hypothetical protein n=1 Tax=Bradyrhizobium sp. UFLA01-814 TaxID=3023480 RepID=UPI00398AF456